MKLFLFVTLLLTTTLRFSTAAQETLRVTGSTTVNPVVSEAAEVLRNAHDLVITIDTAGGSTGGINALGDGRADVGMSSRGLSDADHEKFPSVNFHPIAIGQDAVSVVVAKDVWEGGVKSLTADQIRALYENEVTNWREVGGADQRVVFLNREPGRGEWEVFTKFLYPDRKDAPKTNHAMVGSNEETRNKTGGTRGAVTFLSSPWADGNRVFALGIENTDGEVIQASGSNIASGAYPMSRPLFVITNGEPDGAAKLLIDYLLSDQGQELVAKHGYLRLADLE
ncbi:MAG: phosphate ABC transporter substrate-binding protein [Verrucomicrobiales bacterium]